MSADAFGFHNDPEDLCPCCEESVNNRTGECHHCTIRDGVPCSDVNPDTGSVNEYLGLWCDYHDREVNE